MTNCPSIVRHHLYLKAHNSIDWSWTRCPVSAHSQVPWSRTSAPSRVGVQTCIAAESLALRSSTRYVVVLHDWIRNRVILRSKAALLNLDHPYVDTIVWQRVESFLKLLKKNLSAATATKASVTPVALAPRAPRSHPRPVASATMPPPRARPVTPSGPIPRPRGSFLQGLTLTLLPPVLYRSLTTRLRRMWTLTS
jgi:hypothetical protein